MSSETKKLEKQLRQQELLKNFEGDYYQEKQVGNKWLVKSLSGNTGKWQVAEYSEESFQRYKEYNENKQHLEYLMNKE